MRNALALLVAVLALVGVYVFLPTPEERAAAELLSNANVPPPAPAGAPGAAPPPKPAQLLPQAGTAPGPAGAPTAIGEAPPDPPEVLPCVPLSKRIAGIAGEQFAGKVGEAAHNKYGKDMPKRCSELEKLDDAGMMAEVAKEFGLKP